MISPDLYLHCGLYVERTSVKKMYFRLINDLSLFLNVFQAPANDESGNCKYWFGSSIWLFGT